MEGSRPPNSAGGASRGGFSGNNVALLDQIWLNPREFERQRKLLGRDPDICGKLGDVIAGEIVPRLMLKHKRVSPHAGGGNPARFLNLSTQVADFADLVIRHDVDVADAYVKYLIRRGLDVETLLLHLLAPAARRLGRLWEVDEIDFVDVTIGVSRLQTLLHHLTCELRKPRNETDRHLLLLPAPGEQHTFGLVLASALFRQQGWQVHGVAPIAIDELYSLVSRHSFAVIGFSLSCDRLIETLCSFIQGVRRVSKNKSVQIMVGGRVFAQDPSLRPWVGADLVASDAREALVLAENAVKSVFR